MNATNHFLDSEQIVLINTHLANLRLLYRQIRWDFKKHVSAYGSVTNCIQGAVWILRWRAVIDVCAAWVAERNEIELSWLSSSPCCLCLGGFSVGDSVVRWTIWQRLLGVQVLLTAHLALGRLLSGNAARFHKTKRPLKTKSDVCWLTGQS